MTKKAIMCLLTLGLFSHAAMAAAPSTPANFLASVYSSSAIELFWDDSDDDGFVREYQISQNGVVIKTLDANSLFLDGLSPNTEYRYSILAVDFDNERSPTASLTLRTRSDSTGPSTILNAVTGFNAKVYSSTALELFWNRSANEEGVVAYEILINGAQAALLDATSYYIDSLSPNTKYDFTITAIDKTNTRSSQAVLSATTQAGNGPFISTTLTPPNNLRVQTYTSVSGELFWDRAPADDMVSYYEVHRNGTLLGKTEGISYFDDQVRIGEQVYEVYAIGRDGSRSLPAKWPDSVNADELMGQLIAMIPEIQATLVFPELDDARALGYVMAESARLLDVGEVPVLSHAESDVYNNELMLRGDRFSCDSGSYFAHVTGDLYPDNARPGEFICTSYAFPSSGFCIITVLADACQLDDATVSGEFEFNLRAGVNETDLNDVVVNRAGMEDYSIHAAYFNQYRYVKSGTSTPRVTETTQSTTDLTKGDRVVSRQYHDSTIGDGVVPATSTFEANQSGWAQLPDTLFGGRRLFVSFAPENYDPAYGVDLIGTIELDPQETSLYRARIINTASNPTSLEVRLSVDGREVVRTIDNPWLSNIEADI